MVGPASLLAIEFCSVFEFSCVLTSVSSKIFHFVFACFIIDCCYLVLRNINPADLVLRSWPRWPLRIIFSCVSRGAVLELSFVSRGAVLNVRHLCRGAIVAHLSFVGRGAVNFK